MTYKGPPDPPNTRIANTADLASEDFELLTPHLKENWKFLSWMWGVKYFLDKPNFKDSSGCIYTPAPSVLYWVILICMFLAVFQRCFFVLFCFLIKVYLFCSLATECIFFPMASPVPTSLVVSMNTRNKLHVLKFLSSGLLLGEPT